MKRLTALVLCFCLLLAGCEIPAPPRPAPSRPDAPVAVRVPEQTASSHPEAPSAEQPDIEAEPPQEEGPSPARTAERLAAALREGDIPALEALANPAFGVEGRLDYWKTAALDSVSCEEPVQDGGDWLCRFTLEVSDPGETPLKAGQNICYAQIGYAPYGMWDDYSVLVFSPAQNYYSTSDLQDDPARLACWMRDFAFFETFDDPAEIDREALLDFLLGLAARDYPEAEATPLKIGSGLGYTQAQLDAVAKRYFGFNSFIMTDSRLYDAESGCYVLNGHGGSYRNERVVRVSEKERIHTVWIEQYDDPFQFVPNGALECAFLRSDDGGFRYLSVKAFPAAPES
ncbi:hypothetical protein [uncultured Anaerotruncus sp.]|uniref:hypothetical protein n=1 Tax=uncultured Anaerotruncus sp. TaxID=905011 RepID=UPI00280A9525|nr:hypothetical protein [uncultured Anaerotruncus sp.]